MRLAPGTKLGPYQIIASVGAGGMGEVYRARDSRLDRTVAIKILNDREIADGSAKERFDREARTISSLNHPNICHLYDVAEQDGLSYLILEYLDGQTLADRLLKGALPLDQVQRRVAGPPQIFAQTRIVVTMFGWFQYAVSPDNRLLVNSLPANAKSDVGSPIGSRRQT